MAAISSVALLVVSRRVEVLLSDEGNGNGGQRCGGGGGQLNYLVRDEQIDFSFFTNKLLLKIDNALQSPPSMTKSGHPRINNSLTGRL